MTRHVWLLVTLAACGGNNDGGGGDDDDVDAAPAVVQLNGLTATVEPFTCTPPGQSSRACAAYRLAFVVRNNAQVDTVRLERTRLAVGGSYVAEMATDCTIDPWQIPALNMSPVLDLVFDDRGGPTDGGWPAFNVPCGFNGLTPEYTEPLPPAPSQGTADLTLSVRLADGTLAQAHASATLTLF